MKDINKRKSIQHAKLITELCISAVIMLSAGYIVYKGSSRTRIVEKSPLVELDSTDELSTPDDTIDENKVIFQNIEVSTKDKFKGDLILVNNDHQYFSGGEDLVGVSEQFDNDGVDFIVGNDYNVQLRKTPLLALEQMARDFYAAKNINDLIVISGYRTQEQQKELYDNDLAQTGLDYSELVAKAGYSEHQTGYSIDFSTSTTWDYDGQGDYAWIDENCWKYGYILRYAENKTELTKIKYEPWHYRYVGVPHAYYMYKNGICMEEYIERLKQYTYEGEHLTFTDDNGKNYELYYVPSDDGNETTYVPVPVSLKYEVSGNNIDGFIVTVYTDESTAPVEQSDSSSAESTPEA